MRALVLAPESCTAAVQEVPTPNASTNEIIVRVHAVALNPVDALYTFNPLAPPTADPANLRVVGSDFAGVVTKLGPDVPSHVKVNDRVAGFLQGASSVNFRPGAFAEFVVVPWDLIWKIPESMSFEEASGISLCGLTAAQALFGQNRLGVTAPWYVQPEPELSIENKKESRRTLLIYGASTSVGIYTAQLLRHTKEKFRLVGVASSKHFQWLSDQPYAYDHLVDYRSDWVGEVRKLTDSGGLDLAFDCISEGKTVESISELMEPQGRLAVVRSLQGGAWKSAGKLPIQPSYGAVWEGLGKEVVYKGMHLPANAEARAFAVDFYQWLSNQGDPVLKPHAIRMMPGGLERIVDDGFQLLGSGLMTDRVGGRTEDWMRPVTAEKLVYRTD
ncbi:hypothetical protein H2198_003943 [Neophaeococcomyces mojaviensis]|uniref:Uncharacterized protein n=1 Tax=Neophaeococcomyces mojaviensis TaxID=3383035 RepID=A0ACC3AAH2_9EURO|nr:hypothetical protein H2198_003943 [Knufia sp. JES_112]